MTTELRSRNASQQLYVRALSQAWRNNIQLHDPSLWLLRDPEVEEKMLRDADIAHAVGFRRHLIAGRQWTVTPRLEGSPRAPVAVSIATELLDGIAHFTGARYNLSRAFFSGSRFARIHGCTRTLSIGDGKPRQWWTPVRMEDLDKRMFRIVPKHDDAAHQITAHWERWNVSSQQWDVETVDDAIQTIRHVYQDDQGSLGHGKALREALGWWWYAKEQVFAESLQAVERFAQGILKVAIDGARDAATGLPNEQLIRDWRDVLEDLRSRHVLVHDQADKIEFLPVSGDGWQLLNTMRAELRSTIFTLILGANLTTSANEGGSYALAEIQENSTEALVQFDRETLEETLTDDLLGCIWYRNHANLAELGIEDEKPRFSITQEKRQDPVERAQVAQILSGMGVQLSLQDVLDQTGFRKPDEGEPVIERPQQVPMPGMPGAPGFAQFPDMATGGIPALGDIQQDSPASIAGLVNAMRRRHP